MKIKIIRVECNEDYDYSSYSNSNYFYFPTEWDEVTEEEYEALKLWIKSQTAFSHKYILVTEFSVKNKFIETTIAGYLEKAKEEKAKILAEELRKKKLKEEQAQKKKEKEQQKLLAKKEEARALYEKLKREFEPE